jgi:hypothetical protein
VARLVFYPSDDAYVRASTGEPQAGIPVTAWSRQSGGTQVTDLVSVAFDGTLGAAIPGGILISDANGLLPAFAGPDGGPAVLWGSHGVSGERLALYSVSGGGGGSSTPPLSDVVTTSTDGALTIGKHNVVDTTSGNRTMTLANGTGGQQVSVEKADATTNTVTVNAANLRGTSGSLILSFGARESLALVCRADGSWWPYAGHKTKTALDGAYGPIVGSDAWLKLHASGDLDALIVGAITRDSNGAATSASVVWPDGKAGAYASTSVSGSFPGAVDAYTVTYVGTPTKTVTQPAVTRDSVTGAVTNRPAMTVS